MHGRLQIAATLGLRHRCWGRAGSPTFTARLFNGLVGRRTDGSGAAAAS